MLPWIEIWVLKNDWTLKRTIMAKITRKTWRFFLLCRRPFLKTKRNTCFFLKKEKRGICRGEVDHPKNPWDVMGCQVATGCHERRVWCFHRKVFNGVLGQLKKMVCAPTSGWIFLGFRVHGQSTYPHVRYPHDK